MKLVKFLWVPIAMGVLLSGCGGSSGAAAGSAGVASSGSSGASNSGSSSGTTTGTSSGSSSSGSSSGSGSSGSGSSTTTNKSATLSWTAPTQNSDGSALTDLSGYYIYYGTSATSLTNMVNISSPSTLSYVVTNLSSGTWYFAVSAYTSNGSVSPMSNVGSKTIS